jgi:hypothetical protein
VKLKDAMKSAKISVDEKPVRVVKSSFWGVPQEIEFTTTRTVHNIRFEVDGVSCVVENVSITANDQEIESCSFKK